MPKVVNIDTPSWSPEQVARELTQRVEDGDVKAVVVAIEMIDEIAATGYVFDWIGSKQNFNERVYLITWLYQRMIHRIFPGGR